MKPSLAPRFDIYASIHKALRLAMTENLVRWSGLDTADAGQRQAAVVQLRSLIDLCRSHVDHENRHVHPAIESRCPGLTHRIAGEHDHHIATLDALEADVVTFQCAPDAASAFGMYRHLALFVAENFEHMDFEESVHNTALWAQYSDEELMAIEQAILSSIEPAEMAVVLHWMLPAITHEARAAMLGGMRANAPAPAYESAMQIARQRLQARDWARLLQALEPQEQAA